MGGFGIGEAVLIVAVLAGAAVVGIGVWVKLSAGGGSPEFERRVLDELEALGLRLDMIAERLDGRSIEDSPEAPRLPGDPE
jgi:hypothetical protein